MAAKNSVKIYAPDSYYHLYNRGVAKNNIFLDEFDYSVFLSYLKDYLLPKDEEKLKAIATSPETSYKEKYEADKLFNLKNFYEEIELLAYALLPNHFHLLIKQKGGNSIDNFMNALGTRYSGFFNRKYHRVGPVCQGVYKAVMIGSGEQLLHVSRYIHLNPFVKLKIKICDWPKIPWPFSLPEYLHKRTTAWIKNEDILANFSEKNSYLDFVDTKTDLTPLAPLTIDIEDP